MGMKRFLWASALALAATFALAGPAGAAFTDYPQAAGGDTSIRDFNGADGGWAATVDREPPLLSDVLCALEPLTCMEVNPHHVASGGPSGAGDGYLSTEFSGVSNLLTTTTVSWLSPAFPWHGVDGGTPSDTTDDVVPDDVFMTLDRRTDAEALIKLLDSGSFSVYVDRLIPDDPSTPGDETDVLSSQTVYDHLPVTDVEDWASLPAVDLDPSSFAMNAFYRVRVEMVLSIPVGVIPDAAFDFDNVLLRAVKLLPGEADNDNDGIPNSADNCPENFNPGQENTYGDARGDACEPAPNNDNDNDGIPNASDNCPENFNPGQENTYGDARGDVCEPRPTSPDNDPDGDGVPTPQDNCPTVPNPGQADSDGDGAGDACDANPDGPGGTRPGGGSAVFDGRNLFIKLQCFGVEKKGKCITRATAFKSEGGTRYTFPIQRIVDAKRGKVIRARVRFQFRSELERRKSIVLRSALRESRKDKTKTTKYKTLKLIDRT